MSNKTLFDEYAMAALTGVLSNDRLIPAIQTEDKISDVIEITLLLAEAMMEERKNYVEKLP